MYPDLGDCGELLRGDTSSQRASVLRLMCIQTLVIVARGDGTKCCLFVLCCSVCVCFAEEAEHQRTFVGLLADQYRPEETKERLKIVPHYECATVN